MSDGLKTPPLRGAVMIEFNVAFDNQRTLSMILREDLLSPKRGETADAFQLSFSMVREARVRLSATTEGPIAECDAVKVSDPIVIERDAYTGGDAVECRMRRYEIDFDRAAVSVVAKDARCTVVQTLRSS